MEQHPGKPMDIKVVICIILFNTFLGSFLLKGQVKSLEMQFGVSVNKPTILHQKTAETKWTYNFWIGMDHRKMVNPTTAVHIGFMYNAFNYKIVYKDSSAIDFLTMRCLGVPLLAELDFPGNPMAIYAGVEPRITISGTRYVNNHSNANSINFSREIGIYRRFNGAVKLGLSYRKNHFTYFLQGCSDVMPFKTELGEDFYNTYIVFGFTLLPITASKR